MSVRDDITLKEVWNFKSVMRDIKRALGVDYPDGTATETVKITDNTGEIENRYSKSLLGQKDSSSNKAGKGNSSKIVEKVEVDTKGIKLNKEKQTEQKDREIR